MSSDKVRIAVVGAAGAFGMKHLDGLANIPDAEVTVVSGTKPEPTQAVADKYGVPTAVVGYDAVLERDDVDAVILATPTGLHASQTQAALAAPLIGEGRDCLQGVGGGTEADQQLAKGDRAYIFGSDQA